MEQPGFKMTQEYTYDGVAAVLLIKTDPKMTAEVAEQVARMNEEEIYGNGHTTWGVRWVATIRPDDGSEEIAHVVANVKVRSQTDLDLLTERIRDEVEGVLNPTSYVVDEFLIRQRGHNSLPR